MAYESVSKSMGKLIVYGGHGSLGAACVKYMGSKKFWVGNIDYTENKEADFNIVVPHLSWQEQENFVVNELGSKLKKDKLNSIICVPNCWEKYNTAAELSKQVEFLTRKCIWSSTIAATLAVKYLKPGGLLVLYGSKLALSGNSEMMGYGMVKAAVHHLTKSLAHPLSGFPEASTVIALLPDTLDTVENRKWHPAANFSYYTPLIVVNELLVEWITNKDCRPSSGSLICMDTKDKRTKVMRVLTDTGTMME